MWEEEEEEEGGGVSFFKATRDNYSLQEGEEENRHDTDAKGRRSQLGFIVWWKNNGSPMCVFLDLYESCYFAQEPNNMGSKHSSLSLSLPHVVGKEGQISIFVFGSFGGSVFSR